MNVHRTVVHRQVEIGHALGLHLRPASQFAQEARRFTAEVRVRFNGSEANGKCVIDLLCLAAEGGMVLDLEAHGHDAEEAVAVLTTLISARTHESEEGRVK